MRLTTDGITGYVAGGMGNQLFMLAAAWEQASRLDCPLYLEASSYEVNKLYPYGLDGLDVPAVRLLPEQSPWRTVPLPFGRHWPAPRRLPGRVYLERSAAHFSPKIFQVRPGTTLVGYFQSSRYFPGVRPALLDSLWRVPESPAETAIISDFRSRPAITLHLRRGDYLAAADKAFLATVAYARRALDLVRRAGYDQHVRVFTDSVDLVREELRGTDGLEFVDKDAALGTIATLKAMAAGQAMIMSNSTFSWWAATLMRSRPEQQECLIVAPRPWTASGESRADLLEPDWVTLDAR
ncbi:MAG TPA: alpha-1,2-fucosyltransferase [Jiangellales bacterium]|nr:alpha-1,2-fucosyltransferase [Jiangellales bacterium]